jgi:hypothetical protein
MKITFYSVYEYCIEEYTCVTLLDNRLASYTTKELAQQHVDSLVPYFIYGSEKVGFQIVEETVEIVDSIDFEAIKLYNKSNEPAEDIEYINYERE